MSEVQFDMNTAIALLEGVCGMKRFKHWRVQCVNRGDKRGYECTIWGNGRRVSAYSAMSPSRAVERAIEKLHDKSATKLKVVG